MCCLFGIVDYGKSLSMAQKEHILTVLSRECELRGVDATGIAYNGQGRLHIYKRPLPAHKMRFHVMPDTNIIMGHTRMTTQGSEQKNRNNHPFRGKTFALAHNGIIENYEELKEKLVRHGYRFYSDTDTEAAVKLVDYYYKKYYWRYSVIDSMYSRIFAL